MTIFFQIRFYNVHSCLQYMLYVSLRTKQCICTIVIIFLSLDGTCIHQVVYHLRIIELPSIWLLCTLLYDPKVIRNLHRDCRTITLHTTQYSAASQLDVVHTTYYKVKQMLVITYAIVLWLYLLLVTQTPFCECN